MYFMIFSNIIGWQFICVCSFTYGGEYLLLVFSFTTLELDFRREAPMDKKGHWFQHVVKDFLANLGT